MYHVYILQSQQDAKHVYIGFSSGDMDIRLKRHNEGSTPATSRYRPWDIIWYGSFVEKSKALDFERYLKTGSGRAFSKKHLF